MKGLNIRNKLFALLVALSCFAGASYGQGYTGLVGRWPFNGSAADVSGNGLNGVVSGATLVAGSMGLPNTAYNFNGTSDFIGVPYNPLMNTTRHSICAKVKAHAFNSGVCQGNSIFWRGVENTPTFSYHLEIFDNPYDNNCSVFSPNHEVFGGSTGFTVSSSPISAFNYNPPTDTGVWYCVVLTYDGDTIRTYVDGVLKSRFFQHCTYTASTESLTIGKGMDAPPFVYWLNGTIDEIRLYNRPLSLAEVQMFCDSMSMPIVATCDTISLADTIHACPGSTVTLTASLYGSGTLMDARWTPSAGISDTGILSPTLNVGTTSGMRYITTHTRLPGNLVANGDFSLGNTGFSSAYGYVSGPSSLFPPSVYTITTDPHLQHGGAFSFHDHTTGSGNMMAINGASSAINVWCQTISVTPGTYYDFSSWFSNWSMDTLSGLPQLVFEINGVPLSTTPFIFVPTPGHWTQYSSSWYSGVATTATICIRDLSLVFTGNDFAIDDISFQQYCTAVDSVYIALGTGFTASSYNTSVCLPSSFSISAPTGHSNYLWNIGSSTPSIAVSAAGTYWVSSDSGLCATFADTFHVTGITYPIVHLGNDTAFCTGSSITLTSVQPTGSIYLWSSGSTSSSINTAISGTYWLGVTDSGCASYDTIVVTTIPNPIVNLGSDVTLCTGDTLILTSAQPAGSSYIWNTGSTNDSITITTAGTYWLSVTKAGCTGVDNINVSFNPIPVVDLGPDTVVCAGTPFFLASTVIYTAPTTYLWSNGTTSPVLSTTTSGTYWLAVTQGGCTGRDSAQVSFSAPLYLYLGADTSFCYTGQYLLLSSTQPAGTQYLWSTGSSADTIHVTTSGNYWLQVSNGCSAADTIRVTIGDGPSATPFINENICLGDTVALGLAAHSDNASDYTWNFAGAQIITHNSNHGGPYTVKWNTPGVYVLSLVAISAEGCIGDTIYDTVYVHTQPDAHIVVDNMAYIHCLQDSVSLRPSVIDNSNQYLWQPEHFFSDPLAPIESGRIEKTGFVVLTVTDPFGCKAADSVLFNPDSCCIVSFPTAFTPNADGKNDVFRPINAGNLTFHNMRVFNRWGETVFESTNSKMEWDGTFNGVPQDLGVFYYFVKYDCAGSSRIQRGEVTLIR